MYWVFRYFVSCLCLYVFVYLGRPVFLYFIDRYFFMCFVRSLSCSSVICFDRSFALELFRYFVRSFCISFFFHVLM